MKTKSFNQTATALILGSLLGCHQEPVLPTSIIPDGCRLGLVETIAETSTTRRAFQYDDFGSVVLSSDTAKSGGLVTGISTQTFTYSPDRYLQSQDSRTVEYKPGGSRVETRAQSTYRYEGEPKRIKRSEIAITGSTGLSTIVEEFEYEGDRLKANTYSTSAGGFTIRNEFGADGRLQAIVSPGTTFTVINGKNIRRESKSETVNEDYYPTGRIKFRQVVYPSKERYEVRYEYDDKPNIYQGQLLYRGFPQVDFGGDVRINNLTSYQITYYAADGKIAAQTTETYQHRYNSQGYSLGYASSLGNRAKYYYTNCP